MTDGYAVTAQFYDVMAATVRAPVEAQIASRLVGLDICIGPILDIGAGTGLTSALIARVLPGAEILAIEPDPAMRSALMTRVWSDPALRRQVSILPSTIGDAILPDRIAGAVAAASIHHFDPAGRRGLLARLAERLAPEGRVIIEIQCPVAAEIERSRFVQCRMGRVDYEGWLEASAIGSDRQRWRMTYRASIEGREIDKQIAEYDCWTVSARSLVEQAVECGLVGIADNDLVVLTPADRQLHGGVSPT